MFLMSLSSRTTFVEMKFLALLLIAGAIPVAVDAKPRGALRVLQSCLLEDNNPLGTTYSNDTIIACVKDCGATTIVDPSESCASDEVRVEWDTSVGEPGLPGPTGTRGSWGAYGKKFRSTLFHELISSLLLFCMYTITLANRRSKGTHWPRWPRR